MIKEKKRVCIYLTYDQQKIVDKYIGYMLKELKTCVDYLVVVCNETEIVRGNEILEEYADAIHYRENIGFDAGGFKDALCKYIGWDNILKYDELVLANDSMFGPFKPMKTIFSEMNNKKIDFWGLIKHGECINDDIGHFSEHIQSFFLVIRKRMFHSKEFKLYWENMSYYDTFHRTVIEHEIKFTDFFAKLGFVYDVLADVDKNNTSNIRNNFSQYANLSYELIRKRNFPFLKKQQIACESLGIQTQENLRQAIDYIDKKTDYDIQLIWDNIIRTLNMNDLQRSLHLQYIIFPIQCEGNKENLIFLIFIEYKNSFEYVIEYLEEIRKYYVIKIYSEEQENLTSYQSLGYEVFKIRCAEKIKILAEHSVYDLVCVLHDADMISDRNPSCVGKSYFYNIWENLAKNPMHILGIIDLFLKESRLGFLTSPQPNFERYFKEYGREWNGCFKMVYQIIEELGLNCRVSEYRVPFRITDIFWIRGSILKKLENIEESNIKYMPYLWIYLTQDAGYYSGIVESSDYASMNEVNLQYLLQKISAQIYKQIGDFESFYDMQKNVSLIALKDYCNHYKKMLIYGTGKMAEEYEKYIFNAEYYIVSQGQKKPEKQNGLPVKYLSEIQEINEYGIVLCLNEKNQKEVIPLLEEQGVRHYFCV